MNHRSTDRQADPVPQEEGQAQVGEPCAEGAQDDLDHPGRVRGVLDAVPRDRHHRQLLPRLHQRAPLHVLLLPLLLELAHQPLLLRGEQHAVQERFQTHHEGRPLHEMRFSLLTQSLSS